MMTQGSNVALRLPELTELKTNNSFFIGSNPNKTTRAYDFMGYTSRKDIMHGFPSPHESQFVLPNKMCPTVSSKHMQ